MSRNSVGSMLLVGFLLATLSGGCSNDSSSSGTGGKGSGGSGSGGSGTGGVGTGGSGTGGAGTGGAGTGGSGTGGSGTGGAASGGSGMGGGGAVGGASGAAGGNAGTTGMGGSSVGGAGGGGGRGAGGGAGGGAGSGTTSALATIMPFGTGTITGTAAFVTVSDGVQVTINLANCPAGTHGIHIHAGTACTDATTQGGHWGGTGTVSAPTRGEGIGTGLGEITCNAQMVGGPLVYKRVNTDPNLRWTIGGDVASNIIGHPFVVHGLTSSDREGCGVIQGN